MLDTQTPFGRLRNRSVRPRDLIMLTSLFMVSCASGPTPPAEPRAPLDAEPAPSTTNTSNTTFTAEQAAEGQTVFARVCADCHSVSEFRGSDFRYRFRRRTAWNLFTLMSETMPEDAPGSLTPETYVSLVSYVLELNGYEPGSDPLPVQEATLRQLPLDRVPSSPDRD